MVHLDHVTFASEMPERLAGFWAEVLGYEAGEPSGAGSWTASDPRGEGPSLRFNRQPKSPTIELPIHLDVNVLDREAEVARLRGLGAHLVGTMTHSIGELEETFTVMRDVEGNGFCVQGPEPRKEYPYVGNVTFSCAKPERLAAFWSAALGWPEEEVGEDFRQMLRGAGLDPAEFHAYGAVRHPEGRRPRLLFQRREKSPTESIPIHLDLHADDREAETERLVGLGASAVETKALGDRTWTVLRDPEGNPFCVD